MIYTIITILFVTIYSLPIIDNLNIAISERKNSVNKNSINKRK